MRALLEQYYKNICESWYGDYPLKNDNEIFFRVLNTEAIEKQLRPHSLIRIIRDSLGYNNRSGIMIVKDQKSFPYLNQKIQELQRLRYIKEIDWPDNIPGRNVIIYRITNKGKEEYEVPFSLIEQIGSINGVQVNLDPDRKGGLVIAGDSMDGADSWPAWAHNFLEDNTLKEIGLISGSLSKGRRRIS